MHQNLESLVHHAGFLYASVCVVTNVKHSGRSVISSFDGSRISNLHKVSGTLNHNYHHSIFSSKVMTENIPPVFVKTTLYKEKGSRLDIMECPVQSPDLNPSTWSGVHLKDR